MLGGLGRLARPARDVLADRLDGGADAVGALDELGDQPVLAAQDRDRLVGLAQRRVGAADDLVQVLRAAGQAGAELGEDDPEALAVGAAHDVLDQVERHRRRGLLDRECARRRAARCAPLPTSQSTKYSPISDCWRTAQRASLRSVSKPGSETFDGHDHAVGRLAVELEARRSCRRRRRRSSGRRPRRGRTRCRTRSCRSCPPAAVVGAGHDDRRRRGGEHEERRWPGGGSSRRAYGPVARWSSRQSSSRRSSSLQTFEPSGAGSSAAPGQRLTCCVRVKRLSASARRLERQQRGTAPEPSDGLNAFR